MRLSIKHATGFGGGALAIVALAALLGPLALTERSLTAQDFIQVPGPVRSGTTVPATCAVGTLFIKTDAPVGQSFYACPTLNTFVQQGGGTLSAIPTWSKYSMVAIANGVNGCANANGCWQVNGVLGPNKAALLGQDVPLFALPARGHVTDYRFKVAVQCTGAATAKTNLGTTGMSGRYKSTIVNIDVVVADTTMTNGPPTLTGSDTHAATNVVAGLVTTVNNVDQLVTGCQVDYWLLWAVLP